MAEEGGSRTHQTRGTHLTGFEVRAPHRGAILFLRFRCQASPIPSPPTPFISRIVAHAPHGIRSPDDLRKPHRNPISEDLLGASREGAQMIADTLDPRSSLTIDARRRATEPPAPDRPRPSGSISHRSRRLSIFGQGEWPKPFSKPPKHTQSPLDADSPKTSSARERRRR